VRRLLGEHGKFRKRTEAEVWAMIEEDIFPVPECGCHIWMGPITKNGYGTVMIDRQKHYMHRLMYEKSKGPIPEGMNVCHSCDIPSCVNPDHLWLGTWMENQEDKVNKGRASGGRMVGEEHLQAKLTEQDVLEIRRRYAQGETQTALAAEFHVRQGHISNIILKRSWSHI
jgi:hypothetical protein